MKKRNPDQRVPNESRSPILKRTALAAAVTAALTAFGAPGVVMAQGSSAAPPLQLEEIVVTAQRRSQNLQDVPISVAAFNQERMDVQGIRSIADVAKFTPSLSFSSGGMKPFATSISIRGVSSGVGGSTTGIYINDIPIQVRSVIASGNFATTAYPHLFDIKRVEVLRGPQGTLFGSGSEGGTVRFITPEPSLYDSSVYLRTGASTTQYGSPSYEFGVAGGTPIVEGKLGVRASISYDHTGGYVDWGSFYNGNIVEKDVNRNRAFSGRIALKWAPTDRITITPAYYHQHRYGTGPGGFELGVDPNNTNPYFSGKMPFGNGVDDGNYINATQFLTWSKQDMDLYSLKAEYSFDKFDLIYNTGLYKRHQRGLSNFANLDFGLWTAIYSNFVPGVHATYFPKNPSYQARGNDGQDDRFFTQELRLQSTTAGLMDWTVGVFTSQQDIGMVRKVYDPHLGQVFLNAGIPGGTPLGALTFVFGGGLYNGGYPFWGVTSGQNDQKAVFGQVDIHATDHLTVTVGARYAKMEFSFHNEAAGGVNGPHLRIDQGSSSHDTTTPKFGLKWTTDGGKMIYFSAAKGTRSAGYNPPINQNLACKHALLQKFGNDEVPETYEPDSVWSYELGSKFRAFQDKVQVAADVFVIKWDNIIRNISPGNNCPLSYTDNLGTAQSSGLEFTLQYYPTQNLMLSASSGYARVESTSTIYSKDPQGNIVYKPNGNGVNVPVYITRDGAVLDGSHTTFHLGAMYNFTAFQNPSYFRADWSWHGQPEKGDTWDPNSAQYLGAANLFETPDVHTMNVRLGTKFNDWDVSLYVNNLFGQDPMMISRNALGGPYLIGSLMTRPRQIGFTAVLRY